MQNKLHAHTIRALRSIMAVLLVVGLAFLPAVSLSVAAESAFADPSIRNDNDQRNADGQFYLAILNDDTIKPTSEAELKLNLNRYTSPAIIIKNALINPLDYASAYGVGFEDFSEGGISYKLNSQPTDEQIQRVWPSYDPERQTVLWYIIKREYDGWHVDGILLDKEAAPANPEPVDPADPVDPQDPTDPVDPQDPTDPVDPQDPADPVDPADPTGPTNPGDPGTPEGPEAPHNPNPSDPVNPPATVDPTEPGSNESGADKPSKTNDSDDSENPAPARETIDDFDEPAVVIQKNTQKKPTPKKPEADNLAHATTQTLEPALVIEPAPLLSSQAAALMKGAGAATLAIAAAAAALTHALAAKQAASFGAWEQSVSQRRRNFRRSK